MPTLLLSRRHRMDERNLEIAGRLKKTMRERKINQATLSKLTGIPVPNINRYCRGLYLPKMGNVIKICRALNIDPDWLIDGKTDDLKTSKDKLLSLVKSLSESQSEKIMRFIQEYILGESDDK